MTIMTSPPKITKKNSLPMWIEVVFMELITHPHDADVDRRHQKDRELEGPIVEAKYLDQTRRRRRRGPIVCGVEPEATW